MCRLQCSAIVSFEVKERVSGILILTCIVQSRNRILERVNTVLVDTVRVYGASYVRTAVAAHAGVVAEFVEALDDRLLLLRQEAREHRALHQQLLPYRMLHERFGVPDS